MHEASTIEKLASVNEKLQIATSSLQQSIGGITQVMNSQNEKVQFVMIESLQTENIDLNNTVKELWTRNTLFNRYGPWFILNMYLFPPNFP